MENTKMKQLNCQKKEYREEIIRLAYSVAFIKQDEASLKIYRETIGQCFINIAEIEKLQERDKENKRLAKLAETRR